MTVKTIKFGNSLLRSRVERSSKIKSILGIDGNIWAIIQRYIIRGEIVPIATVPGMQA